MFGSGICVFLLTNFSRCCRKDGRRWSLVFWDIGLVRGFYVWLGGLIRVFGCFGVSVRFSRGLGEL